MEQAQVKTSEKTNRLARELDSREVTESRTAMQRPTHWRRPESLPSPDDRPGWKHRWIRIAMMGSSDPKNISSSMREGYEPCKAEDYPEMMMHATDEGRFKGGIEVGGLLLCRIPSEFLVQRAKFYEDQNKANMESVDNNFMRDSDPRMQKFAERQTKVTFGSGT
jgi:hypothetical protein